MQTLHFSVRINAPKEKVWHTLFDDTSYREWTAVFMPGSYFVGNWEKGGKILFLGPSENSEKEGGMISKVAENRPYEFLSLSHVGIVNEGVEDTTSDEAKKWLGGIENYTLREANGITELLIDIDSDQENAEMFHKIWPQALQKVKELAEK